MYLAFDFGTVNLDRLVFIDRRPKAVDVALQGAALLILQIAVPGRFREHVDEPQLHPGAFATATMPVAVGGVIAAAVS